ncbi:hypothetical protein CO731_00295 [Aminobacter sp. MSH1]|nr:hypothetical protein CO731_00295 [Aminobacter sp. MSH1]
MTAGNLDIEIGKLIGAVTALKEDISEASESRRCTTN